MEERSGGVKELEKKEDSVCLLHGRATCKGWNVVKTSLLFITSKESFLCISNSWRSSVSVEKEENLIGTS